MNREQERLVFEALGEASMCWVEGPSGMFDSTRCKEIGDRLVKALQCDQPHLGLATTRLLLAELRARGMAEHVTPGAGRAMTDVLLRLTNDLPESMLNYKTVDNV